MALWPRAGSVSSLSTCYTSNTEKQGELSSESSNSPESPGCKGTCANFIISFELIFISQRHPFHTCRNVLGLIIILRMFRVASRTPEGGNNVVKQKKRLRGPGEFVSGIHLKSFLCVWQRHLWHPFPLHLHKKQHAYFSASSNSWQALVG